MASRAAPVRNAAAPSAIARAMARLNAAIARGATLLAALALLVVAAWLAAAIFDYDPRDPSFSTATGRVATNAAGPLGAYVADALLTLAGWASLAMVPVVAIAALRLVQRRRFGIGRAALGTSGAMVAGGAALGAIWTTAANVPAGNGGVIGLLAATGAAALGDIPALATVPVPALFGVILFPLALGFWLWGSGLGLADAEALAAIKFPERRRDEDDGALDLAATPPPRRVRAEPVVEDRAQPRANVVVPSTAAAPGKRAARERQSALDLGDATVLPSLSLLKPAPTTQPIRIDAAALEQNARLLEGVLEDFGVKGRIGDVRPGPVVTLYELEPAPGIKASRVIGLADDIARSMSALSARVAVVPGRNVIGIELPNARREMVSLRELLESSAFENKAAALPLILGKDISGEPVIVDLAPMPHLLVAGTTGSGKSVGLNAMILSLLYRLRPTDCQLILIDPKMLELSMYDGIPHLLAPVVTEPAKAIRALKWAVEEMDDRYRKMSMIGVRNLAGFNGKVAEAKRAGRPVHVRQFQSGWDPDTEAPIIEEERIDYDPLPLIVVVVDELADLMLTAGKEVEFLIQRLAQKARAAGIHLILATQRPSVDVITGVIKAVLPTRISFQVTSKIDSRTILGEQGAEQLLGKGDMLHMSGGKQVTRVHGPFVSDEEVEAVAAHWRTQGAPAYVSAVTEEPPDIDGQFGLDGFGADDGDEDEKLYRKAVAFVAERQKASTSFLQQEFRLGYNKGARLINRMEADGVVGKPDHVGRREVLIDEAGNRR